MLFYGEEYIQRPNKIEWKLFVAQWPTRSTLGAVLRYQVQTIFFSFSFVVVQSVLLKYIQEMGVEHKTRNYKTPRGEHRQNTLRHTSQQDPL